ncbi:hypothetical protein AVEN_54075-1 [Araneus ventricosus]|uniref:ribonuclease H n=1 Tax=Araneus ventricosus TaxID=182803 RepID=A0A4Y2ICY0_ARAVE|nr:hypothetical protein AVEN_54075-1 [Araneus ventricosus]
MRTYVVWCLDPPVRTKWKLNTIQRPFLLALTGSYRTTKTSALQVILGIPPLQIQQDVSHRHSKTERTDLFGRWRGITSGTRIYTDGSKTEKGVGVAFCVWSEQNIVSRWLAKLQDYNIVFQAELLALKHATDHVTSLLHQPITILVDNQASVQAAANVRSRNTTAKEICKSLITNKYIHISWIKAHVGYDGNEEADRLAKEAAETD